MTNNNTQQSPLDEFLQQNSIMYKGTEGNQYNTSVDDYYIEIDGYSPQGGYSTTDIWPYNPDCSECQLSTPPWWCTHKVYLPNGDLNPEHPCYNEFSSIPIDGALPILMLAGMLLAMFSLKPRVFA